MTRAEELEAIRARAKAGWAGRDVFSLMAEMNDDRAFLLSVVDSLETKRKALSYVHEGGVTQAREYLQEQLGVAIDPIDMSDAIGAYLETVLRAALSLEPAQ